MQLTAQRVELLGPGIKIEAVENTAARKGYSFARAPRSKVDFEEADGTATKETAVLAGVIGGRSVAVGKQIQ